MAYDGLFSLFVRLFLIGQHISVSKVSFKVDERPENCDFLRSRDRMPL